MKSAPSLDRNAGLSLLASAFLIGCASPGKESRPVMRETVRQRAAQMMDAGILLKPGPTPFTNTLAWQLAPLLVLENIGATSRAVSLQLSNIFFREDKVWLAAKLHDQVSFFWRQAEGVSADAGESRWQGIRVTLNTTGQPAVWEVLYDSSGAAVIFVARHLEDAADLVFGGPMPGCRFAVELPLQTAPRVVVAGILDDAPMLMGPLVQVAAATGDAATVLCRCMPVQVCRLTGQFEYTLLPAWAAASLEAEPKGQSIPAWREKPASCSLERRLRLPPDF